MNRTTMIRISRIRQRKGRARKSRRLWPLGKACPRLKAHRSGEVRSTGQLREPGRIRQKGQTGKSCKATQCPSRTAEELLLGDTSGRTREKAAEEEGNRLNGNGINFFCPVFVLFGVDGRYPGNHELNFVMLIYASISSSLDHSSFIEYICLSTLDFHPSFGLRLW